MSMRDFRLPPRYIWELRSSRILCSVVIIPYRRFGTTYRSHLTESRTPSCMYFFYLLSMLHHSEVTPHALYVCMYAITHSTTQSWRLLYITSRDSEDLEVGNQTPYFVLLLLGLPGPWRWDQRLFRNVGAELPLLRSIISQNSKDLAIRLFPDDATINNYSKPNDTIHLKKHYNPRNRQNNPLIKM
jgi:hypothetical protein